MIESHAHTHARNDERLQSHAKRANFCGEGPEAIHKSNLAHALSGSGSALP